MIMIRLAIMIIILYIYIYIFILYTCIRERDLCNMYICIFPCLSISDQVQQHQAGLKLTPRIVRGTKRSWAKACFTTHQQVLFFLQNRFNPEMWGLTNFVEFGWVLDVIFLWNSICQGYIFGRFGWCERCWGGFFLGGRCSQDLHHVGSWKAASTGFFPWPVERSTIVDGTWRPSLCWRHGLGCEMDAREFQETGCWGW